MTKSARAARRWSINAAARSASDSRVLTARHLLGAQCAREWEASRLMNSLTVHRNLMGSDEAAAVSMFGGLGYAQPYPEDMVSAADMILTDDGQALRGADLYVLSPAMLAVVVAAANSLTLADLSLIGPTDPPCPSGIVVLPQPLIVRTVGGELTDDRAYQWYPGQRVFPRTMADSADDASTADTAAPGSNSTWPGIRMTTYCATNGPVRPDSFVQYLQYAREQGTPLPPLLPTARRCAASNGTAEASDQILDILTGTTRRMASQGRAAAAALGLNEDQVDPERAIGEYAPGEPIHDDDDMFTARFLYAFWRLCDQELTVTHPVDLNRTSRDLAEREEISTDVRVVQLRRTTRRSGDQEPAREWHHRWVVRMHKVRQWYPSQQTHKIIYRGPYIKGPTDKPLLDGEIVRALTR